MGCDRCRRRDELDYYNLDDQEKHFLMFMLAGCGQEMIIPDDFLKRFRSEIPREIKLETRNGHSYTVGVAKYPDKVVLREGWGAFVETHDLHMDDCVVFRYKGNSQFQVTVFDRFGREKTSSVIVDNDPPPLHVHERHNSGTENLERSHGHYQPMETPPPTEHANRSEGRPEPRRMQPLTENVSHSDNVAGFSRPMEMQPPTENVDNFCGHSQPMETPSPTEHANRSDGRHQPTRMQPPTANMSHSQGHPQPMQMQPPTENVDIFCGHSQPTQMQPCTETVDYSNYHDQTVQIQLPRTRTKKQSKLQRDNSSQGNKTAMPSSGYSLPLADDTEVPDTPRYTLGLNASLNTLQKKEVDEKVKSIHSDDPMFVAVMKKFNVTGTFVLTLSKHYVKTYVGDKERSICLQRLGKRWEVHFGTSPEVKRFVSGWRKFVQDNGVEVGDICIFELLKIYEMRTMEVHIIHAKDFGSPSQIGDLRVEERRKDATQTVEHSHSGSQLVQMQSPNATGQHSLVHPQPMQMESSSVDREIRVLRDNSSQGNKAIRLMPEDIDDDTVALSGCMGVGLKHLTSVQKKAVKEQVQLIDSEIPICVLVMHNANVTGRFCLSISKKYVDRYLGDEVRSIWLERHGQKYQVTLGRKPMNNRVVGGWTKFVRDNELETGDICLLELLRHCKLTAMRVHIIRANNAG